MAKIFIGMETSGQLRRRFLAFGHSVISCDLLPADDNSMKNHIKGDVFETLEILQAFGWTPDAAVFHPECTYHTVSAAWAFGDGPYHQKVKPLTLVGADRRAAAESDVERIRVMPFVKIIENPIGTLSTRTKLGKASAIVQPYEHGDDASKATCLWLVDADGNTLPLDIKPTRYVNPRMVNGKPRWSNQTDSGQNALTPSANRWSDRSKTFDGIADLIVQILLEGMNA